MKQILKSPMYETYVEILYICMKLVWILCQSPVFNVKPNIVDLIIFGSIIWTMYDSWMKSIYNFYNFYEKTFKLCFNLACIFGELCMNLSCMDPNILGGNVLLNILWFFLKYCTVWIFLKENIIRIIASIPVKKYFECSMKNLYENVVWNLYEFCWILLKENIIWHIVTKNILWNLVKSNSDWNSNSLKFC